MRKKGKVTSSGRAEIKNVEIIFSHFQFQLCHQRVLFKFDFTFVIYGQVLKNWSSDFYTLHIKKFSFNLKLNA